MPDSEQRNLTDAMRAAVTAAMVRPALLVRGSFPGYEARFWSGFGTIAWGGFEWIGAGSLLAIEDVTETVDSAQKGVSIQLSGIPSDVFDVIMLGDYQGGLAEIYLAVFDESMGFVADPFLLWEGVMDSDEISDNGQIITITIFCEGPLADHLRSRVWRYTHEDQQTLYPSIDDKGLEFVAALQDSELKWGTR
jgi:hypothetical protein